MKALALEGIGAGFSVPALASQAVFRATLEALSRPGRLQRAASDAEAPRELHAAAAAIALALLDQDTTLWRAASLESEAVGAYLRFHTGCRLATDARLADFALAGAAELPALEALECGSDEYPDRSATLILQVDSLEEGVGWRFAGPGIRGVARLAVGGLCAAFLAFWARNVALYPRGVDAFLACGERLCGLPRTVRIEA
jgi:alpha-D-ribose 1-methylphosphonate 5-triphosphate synthase subunit PhnH